MIIAPKFSEINWSDAKNLFLNPAEVTAQEQQSTWSKWENFKLILSKCSTLSC